MVGAGPWSVVSGESSRGGVEGEGEGQGGSEGDGGAGEDVGGVVVAQDDKSKGDGAREDDSHERQEQA